MFSLYPPGLVGGIRHVHTVIPSPQGSAIKYLVLSVYDTETLVATGVSQSSRYRERKFKVTLRPLALHVHTPFCDTLKESYHEKYSDIYYILAKQEE